MKKQEKEEKFHSRLMTVMTVMISSTVVQAGSRKTGKGIF